jgi:hypothetical protein
MVLYDKVKRFEDITVCHCVTVKCAILCVVDGKKGFLICLNIYYCGLVGFVGHEKEGGEERVGKVESQVASKPTKETKRSSLHASLSGISVENMEETGDDMDPLGGKECSKSASPSDDDDIPESDKEEEEEEENQFPKEYKIVEEKEEEYGQEEEEDEVEFIHRVEDEDEEEEENEADKTTDSTIDADDFIQSVLRTPASDPIPGLELTVEMNRLARDISMRNVLLTTQKHSLETRLGKFKDELRMMRRRHREVVSQLNESREANELVTLELENSQLDKEISDEKVEEIQTEVEECKSLNTILQTELIAMKKCAGGMYSVLPDEVCVCNRLFTLCPFSFVLYVFVSIGRCTTGTEGDQVISLREALHSIGETITSLKVSLVQKGNENDRLQQQIDALVTIVEDQKKKMSSLEKSNMDLEDEVDASRDSQDMIEKLSERNLQLEEDNVKQKEEIEDLENLKDMGDELEEHLQEELKANQHEYCMLIIRSLLLHMCG